MTNVALSAARASGVDSILALDLATSTGWARIHTDGSTISWGSVNFAGNGRYAAFHRWIASKIDEFPPALIAVEKPGSLRNMHAVMIACGFLGILQAVAGLRDIAVMVVPNKSWKKHMTGNGGCSKGEYIDAVQNNGYDVENEDEAAAVGILLMTIDLVTGKVRP